MSHRKILAKLIWLAKCFELREANPSDGPGNEVGEDIQSSLACYFAGLVAQRYQAG